MTKVVMAGLVLLSLAGCATTERRVTLESSGEGVRQVGLTKIGIALKNAVVQVSCPDAMVIEKRTVNVTLPPLDPDSWLVRKGFGWLEQRQRMQVHTVSTSECVPKPK